MLKNIQEIWEIIIKEASKFTKKLKNLGTGMHGMKGTSKISSEIVKSNEINNIEKYRDIEKLKRSYERLMRKYVNPSLNLLSPSIKIYDTYKDSKNELSQDDFSSTFVNVVWHGKQKLPLVPSTVHELAPSNLLFGWSGQPLNEQAIYISPELSTKAHDTVSASFIFPELVDEPNNRTVAKTGCIRIVSNLENILNTNDGIRNGKVKLTTDETPSHIPNKNMSSNKLLFNTILEPKNNMLKKVIMKQNSEPSTNDPCTFSNLITTTHIQPQSSNTSTEEINHVFENLPNKLKGNTPSENFIPIQPIRSSEENPTKCIISLVSNKRDFQSHSSNDANAKNVVNVSIAADNEIGDGATPTKQCFSNENKEDTHTYLNTQTSMFTVNVADDLNKECTKEVFTCNKILSENRDLLNKAIANENPVTVTTQTKPTVTKNKHCKPSLKNKNAYWISTLAKSKVRRIKPNVIDIMTACPSTGLCSTTEELITQKNKSKYTKISKPKEKTLNYKMIESNSNTHCQVYEKLNDNLNVQRNKLLKNVQSNIYTSHHSNESSKLITTLIGRKTSNILPSMENNSTNVDKSKSTVININTKNKNIKRTPKYLNDSHKHVSNKKWYFNPYLNQFSYKAQLSNSCSQPQNKIENINSECLGRKKEESGNSESKEHSIVLLKKRKLKLALNTKTLCKYLKLGKHNNLPRGNHNKVLSCKIKKAANNYLNKKSLISNQNRQIKNSAQFNPGHESYQEHSSRKLKILKENNQLDLSTTYKNNKTNMKKSEQISPESTNRVVTNYTNFKVVNSQVNLLTEKDNSRKKLESSEETNKFKNQLICNESLSINYDNRANRNIIKQDNITKYNNREVSRKLHSKNTGSKLFNLKMYGSVRNKAIPDLIVPKSIPLSRETKHKKKLDKVHTSSLSIGNKQNAVEIENKVFPITIQSRNMSVNHKVSTSISHTIKRYATTLTNRNTIHSPENKFYQLGTCVNDHVKVFKKAMVRANELKEVKQSKSNNNNLNKHQISNSNNDIIYSKIHNHNPTVVKSQTKIINNNFVKIPYGKNMSCRRLEECGALPKRISYLFNEVYNNKLLNKDTTDNSTILKLNRKPQPPILSYGMSKSETAFMSKNKIEEIPNKESSQLINKPKPSQTDFTNERQMGLKNCNISKGIEKNKVVKYKWDKSDGNLPNTVIKNVNESVTNELNDSTSNNIFNHTYKSDCLSCTEKLILKDNPTTTPKSPSIKTKKIYTSHKADGNLKIVEQVQNNTFLSKQNRPIRDKWKSKIDRLNDWKLQTNKYECRSQKRTLIKTYSKRRNADVITSTVNNNKIINVGKKCINGNPDSEQEIINFYQPNLKEFTIGQCYSNIDQNNYNFKKVKSSSFIDSSNEILVKNKSNGLWDSNVSHNDLNQTKQNVCKFKNYKKQLKNKTNEISAYKNIEELKDHFKKIATSVQSAKIEPFKRVNPEQINSKLSGHIQTKYVPKYPNDDATKISRTSIQFNSQHNEENKNSPSSNKSSNNNNENSKKEFSKMCSIEFPCNFLTDSKGSTRRLEQMITEHLHKEELKKNTHIDESKHNSEIILKETEKSKNLNKRLKLNVLSDTPSSKVKEISKYENATKQIKKDRFNHGSHSSIAKSVVCIKNSIPLNITGTKANKKIKSPNAVKFHNYYDGFSTRMINDVSNQSYRQVNKVISVVQPDQYQECSPAAGKNNSTEKTFNSLKSNVKTDFDSKNCNKVIIKSKIPYVPLQSKNIVNGQRSKDTLIIKNSSNEGKNKLKLPDSVDQFQKYVNNTVVNGTSSCSSTAPGILLRGMKLTTAAQASTSILKTNKGLQPDSSQQHFNNSTITTQSPIKTDSLKQVENKLKRFSGTQKSAAKEKKCFNRSNIFDDFWNAKHSIEYKQVPIHPIEKEEYYINIPSKLNPTNTKTKKTLKQP